MKGSPSRKPVMTNSVDRWFPRLQIGQAGIDEIDEIVPAEAVLHPRRLSKRWLIGAAQLLRLGAWPGISHHAQELSPAELELQAGDVLGQLKFVGNVLTGGSLCSAEHVFFGPSHRSR